MGRRTEERLDRAVLFIVLRGSFRIELLESD
jgi:hypothetical protein